RLINQDANGFAGVLLQKSEVAPRDFDAVGHLARDAFQTVFDHLQILAGNIGGVADALVDHLDQAGNNRDRAVDVMDDAGVNLAAVLDDFLFEPLGLQFNLEALQFLGVVANFRRERAPLDGGRHRGPNGGNVERFVQKVVGAVAQSLAQRLDGFISGQHDDFNVRVQRFKLSQQVDA